MKQVVQGFATALLLAGALMLYFHFSEAPQPEKIASASAETQPDTDDMKKELEKSGLHVLKQEEFDQLTEKKSEPAAVKNKETKKQEQTFTLKLVSGMTSDDVATALEKAEIIEDGAAFRTYLDVTKASKALQVGDYKVDSQMTYEEIANLMTK
ncbi:endolytic transglycosylase MltG [Terribacillus saccharophilus]|uniref:endolytic transglycosylase MltG n=1 Tax=Terribacillus saccharophilus TaxID=361277 RepID=UPI003981DC27